MVREGWIDRPRLLQRLDQIARSQLLLIAAPAGYGKTTLVTQWAARRDPTTVAWVRLERADDDPARLWSRLVAAVELVGCRVDGTVAEFSAMSSTTVLNRARRVSIRAAGERRVTVVVEDCHVLRSAETSGYWAGSWICCPPRSEW